MSVRVSELVCECLSYLRYDSDVLGIKIKKIMRQKKSY